MKTIIAGPRHYHPEKARELVREALSACPWVEEITSIVHGGATGIDQAAAVVCADRWPVEVCEADWGQHGRAAGPLRNRQMAASSDALVAVWDRKSPGTENMIKTAQKMGLRVYIYFSEPSTARAETSKGGLGLA